MIIWCNVAIKFHRMTQGEFTRMIETKTISKIIAQESAIKPLKFHVAGINEREGIAYIMRYGRVNELRTWRLDNLAIYLKDLNAPVFETQFQPKK